MHIAHKQNLKEELCNKAPDSAKQAHIYTVLRTLLKEIDKLSFNDCLDMFSVETKDFHTTSILLPYILAKPKRTMGIL